MVRVVVPGCPQHITQRGSSRQEPFFGNDDHLLAATRYIERNLFRAKIVRKPWRYRYSSAWAHVEGRADPPLSGTSACCYRPNISVKYAPLRPTPTRA